MTDLRFRPAYISVAVSRSTEPRRVVELSEHAPRRARPLTSGAWTTLGTSTQNPDFWNIVLRSTATSTTPEVANAFGSDVIFGDGATDELIGQQGADVIQGNDGSDAIVGDLGKVTTTLETGGRAITPRTNAPFMSTPIRQPGTLTRQVQLFTFAEASAPTNTDILLGGAGTDAVHGGPGVDYINGGSGDDVMWGGPGNDDEFGGYGNDYLDVVPRPADPQSWKTDGAVDHLQGYDLLYSGFDSDAMQADFQQNGPGIADRLVDRAGPTTPTSSATAAGPAPSSARPTRAPSPTCRTWPRAGAPSRSRPRTRPRASTRLASSSPATSARTPSPPTPTGGAWASAQPPRSSLRARYGMRGGMPYRARIGGEGSVRR